jgi:16S rRNA U1498 N3-methylase RsmE
MAPTDPDVEGTVPPSGQRQLSLDEFADIEQCTAIAESTSEQCQRDALPGVPYCPLHLDALLQGDD